MIRLTYGNTNTFLLGGAEGYLLVDTDRAGTLPAFWRAIKAAGVVVRDIRFVLATHYHPDHIGLIPALMRQGVTLLLADAQTADVHASDPIFAREPRLRWEPIDEREAVLLPCAGSRAFLGKMGIAGEIVSTPSHSRDSISVLLDGGDAFVGDLERRAVLPAYGEDAAVRQDWERILAAHPKRIFYAHGKEETL